MPEYCDPACVKLIINSGLVAPLASELAGLLGGPARAAALGLAGAAKSLHDTYTALVDQNIIDPVDAGSWAGCDQATDLISWIESDELPHDAAETMRGWAIAMRQITASLVSGQFSVSEE